MNQSKDLVETPAPIPFYDLSQIHEAPQNKESATFPYKSILFTQFKRLFIKELTQNVHLDFQTLLLKSYPLSGLEASDVPDYIRNELFLWFENTYDLSWSQDYLDDKSIKEMIIHNGELVHLEKNGKIEVSKLKTQYPLDLELSFEVLALKNNVEFNLTNPFISFFITLFGHYFRASLLHFSILSSKNSKLFLRRIENSEFTFSHFEIPSSLKTNFEHLVRSKKNILISGSTSSGKTSFMTVLLSSIDTSEHLIILEDTHEIKLNRPQWTQLLSNEKIEGKTLKDFCAYALRMRPDRIIVGELRSKEIVPFILSMNTGHSGLMSTIHADSAKDAILRSALLFSLYASEEGLSYQKILKLICQNIHYVIHMKERRINQVIEILGSEEEQIYFNQIL